MTLGSRIMQIRTQRRLTQSELGKRSGLASSYLSRIENRKLEPGPKTLLKIAEALGVKVADFFESGPSLAPGAQCVVSLSGKCVMDLMIGRRRNPKQAPGESYSPKQLQLLRMANFLIQTGAPRVVETMEVLLTALSQSSRRRSDLKKILEPGPPAPDPSGG